MVIPARVRASVPHGEDGKEVPGAIRRAPEAGSGTLLHLAGAVDAVTGVGQRLQARLWDRRAALLALAECSVVDAVQGLGDLVQHLLLILNQAESKLLFKVIGPEVRHVNGRVRQVAAA